MTKEYDTAGAMHYVRKMHDKKTGAFKYHRRGNSTVLSTSFGVQLAYLLNDLSSYSGDQIVGFLSDQQDASTGCFIDKNFDINDLSEFFEHEYILWQFTYFSTIALDMLGVTPSFPFAFLRKFKNEDAIATWLSKQNYNNFWYSSNKIMFLLYFLTYEQERSMIDNRKLIKTILDYLDSIQDPTSGFWGIHAGATLENAMFGAAHIYLLYKFHERNIQHKERIVKSVLSLQNSNGLYGPPHGGACEDYDSIEIFSVVEAQSRRTSEQVVDSIRKTYSVICKSQNRDGSFPYSVDVRDNWRRFKDKLRNRKHCYKYSGWPRMESSLFGSDLWATYFRVLTIAKIEKMLANDARRPYRFYSLPGWGY